LKYWILKIISYPRVYENKIKTTKLRNVSFYFLINFPIVSVSVLWSSYIIPFIRMGATGRSCRSSLFNRQYKQFFFGKFHHNSLTTETSVCRNGQTAKMRIWLDQLHTYTYLIGSKTYIWKVGIVVWKSNQFFFVL